MKNVKFSLRNNEVLLHIMKIIPTTQERFKNYTNIDLCFTEPEINVRLRNAVIGLTKSSSKLI